MSILVAITGPKQAIVATDSRRVENDGQVRDDFCKTFRLDRIPIIGGHTGLLEFAGRTLPDWIKQLPLPEIKTIDELASAANEMMKVKLAAVDPAEVSFEWRKMDIVFVGRPDLRTKGRCTIRAVVLRPSAQLQSITCEIRTFEGYCVTGDDQPQSAVLQVLRSHRPPPNTLPADRLRQLAKKAICVGIERASPHPKFGVPTCGGSQCIVSL